MMGQGIAGVKIRGTLIELQEELREIERSNYFVYDAG